MKRNVIRPILALVLVLCTLAPAFAQQLFPPSPSVKSLPIVGKLRPVGDLWLKTDLYFGTNKPDGTVVTDEEFKKFLDEVVTPRFPDGLTLLTGYGQFRDSNGKIQQERSMLLILLYPPPASDANKKIEEIRSLYKETFKQESVLRVDSHGSVSF